MQALLNKMEGIDESEHKNSDYQESSSSGDYSYSSSSESSPAEEPPSLKSEIALIRESTEKIERIKRSLTNKTTELKEERKQDMNNPLSSDNEDNKTEFEGGEETDQIKPKKRTKKVIKRKKKIPGKSKDINSEINMCVSLMNKARKITEEYNKIFQSINKNMNEDISMETRCRLDAEMNGIKMHRSIITMITETLDNNKIKENEEILAFHESKTKENIEKQKEYNSVIKEITSKLSSKSNQIPIEVRREDKKDDESSEYSDE